MAIYEERVSCSNPSVNEDAPAPNITPTDPNLDCGDLISCDGRGEVSVLNIMQYINNNSVCIDGLKDCCIDLTARVVALENWRIIATEQIRKLNECVFPVGEKSLCDRVTDVEDCCDSITGLPSGAVTFVNHIYGTYDVVHNDVAKPDQDGNPLPMYTWEDPQAPGAWSTGYEFYESKKVFRTADFEYLKTVGKPLVLSVSASIGYKTRFTSTAPHGAWSGQWSTVLYIDGTRVKSQGDSYALNSSGYMTGLADNFSVTVPTTGRDIEVSFRYVYIAHRNHATLNYDMLQVDMGSATILLTGSDK